LATGLTRLPAPNANSRVERGTNSRVLRGTEQRQAIGDESSLCLSWRIRRETAVSFPQVVHLQRVKLSLSTPHFR